MNIFENIETIAPAIRAGRNVLGWTQKELAEKSNLSMPTIARLEAGENPIAATVLVVISALRAEGVTFDWQQDGFKMDYTVATLPPVAD